MESGVMLTSRTGWTDTFLENTWIKNENHDNHNAKKTVEFEFFVASVWKINPSPFYPSPPPLFLTLESELL